MASECYLVYFIIENLQLKLKKRYKKLGIIIYVNDCFNPI